MSNPEHPKPPRRQFPEAYEKSLPIILGILVFAIIVLLILVIVFVVRGA